jgi:NAD-dependent dihydropyrimidine dehydrogenase PreA subunit
VCGRSYPEKEDLGAGVTYIIAEPCVDVKDKACIEECPVDCIYEGGRMLYIHPDECVDCGACEPVCPVEAIFYEDDTPDQWSGYVNANVDFFDELGSPGGATKLGKVDSDPAFIKELPPMAGE